MNTKPITYPHGIGLVITNLQMLELILRSYLHEQELLNDPTTPKITDLYKVKEGQKLPVNALTNYDSLDKLIKKYNGTITDPSKKIDESIIGIRDSFAHGRCFTTIKDQNTMRLIKFSREDKKTKTVTVTHNIELSMSEVTEMAEKILAQTRKMPNYSEEA